MQISEQKKIKVKIITVGCRLNKAETAQLESLLLAAGYEIVPKNSNSDIYIVHSCAVTARAEEDSIRLAKTAKEKNPETFTIIAGCLPELYLKTNQKLPADLILGKKEKYKIVEYLKNHGFASTMPIRPNLQPIPPHFSTKRAIIKIQDGCSFNCSYCVVPKTRGAPESRPLEQIILEARALSANYPEIVLTGANSGSYNDNGRSLVHLVQTLASLPEIKRIRLSSIETSTVEKEIIDLMAEHPKICRYLHLPLQSGSNRILKMMRRHYTVEEYLSIIKYATSKLNPVGIGTDVIAGFPGETDYDFERTCNILNEMPFSNIHAFSFSIRPQTTAASLIDQLPAATIKQRTRKLMEIGETKKTEFARKLIGTPVEVLIEKVIKTENAGIGWTKEYVLAKVSGKNLKEKQIVHTMAKDYKAGMLLSTSFTTEL
jgi:threonylcarbamoyladenosine tRNA methylthiotransferase MtaB